MGNTKLSLAMAAGFGDMSTENYFCIALKSCCENIKIYTKCATTQFVEM